MPHQEKNIIGRNKQLMMLLPITGALFVKKTQSNEPDENSIDFHLGIIKRIDTLLAEHEREAPSAESSQAPPILPPQPPTPIEPRPPMNKTLSHREIAWEPALEQTQTLSQTIPEEFKTELVSTPQFRFISSREFLDTISRIIPAPEERIEIIDLGTLIGDTTTLQNTKNQADETYIPSKKQVVGDERHHKKTEVIDARSAKQKVYEEVYNNALKQADQIEKKAHVYFLNSKSHDDKKQKKLDIEQSYIPVDFEERSKEIKEKQDKEEEQKRQEEEKILKQLEREHEKLEKLETKKTELEEKKQELKQKEKKAPKKDLQPSQTKKDLKKEAKEQKRLQRLEIRKAHILERQHKKEEKQALKHKQKQQHIKMKGSKNQQKLPKQKTEGKSLFKKEKNISSLELDEDLKKVLLMTDTLLGELPEDVLNRFVQSEEFELYEKVLSKYKIK